MSENAFADANTLVTRVMEDLKRVSPENVDDVRSRLMSRFGEVVRVVHSELPLGDANSGAKLSTAACVPLWEALHVCSNSSFSPLSTTQHAFLVQFLTSLYPKANDRRCVWQNQGCFGDIGAEPLPLSVSTPAANEFIVHPDLLTSAAPSAAANQEPLTTKYLSVLRYVNATGPLEHSLQRGDKKGVDQFTQMLRTFVKEVLPKCDLVGGESEGTNGTATSGGGAVGIKIFTLLDDLRIPSSGLGDRKEEEDDQGKLPFALRTLRHTVWKFLLLSQAVAQSESDALVNVLTESAWSKRTVSLAQREGAGKGSQTVTYQSLFQPLVDQLVLAITLTAAPQNANENAPLVDPHIVTQLVESADAMNTLFVAPALRSAEAQCQVIHARRAASRLLLHRARDAVSKKRARAWKDNKNNNNNNNKSRIRTHNDESDDENNHTNNNSSNDCSDDSEQDEDDIVLRKMESVKELCEFTIPGEVEMDGTSASCRDCDQLTRFCRDIALLPVAPPMTTAPSLSHSLVSRILFDRMRASDEKDTKEGDNNNNNSSSASAGQASSSLSSSLCHLKHASEVLGQMVESPALLPVTSSMADYFGEKAVREGNRPTSTLERVVMQWASTEAATSSSSLV